MNVGKENWKVHENGVNQGKAKATCYFQGCILQIFKNLKIECRGGGVNIFQGNIHYIHP